MACCLMKREEEISLLGRPCFTVHDKIPDLDEQLQQAEDHPIFPSYRLLVCLIAFLGSTCAVGSQALVGASLLLMIRHHDDVNVTGSMSASSSQASAAIWNTREQTLSENYRIDEWHYSWSKTTKGWLTSSYFVGYYVMQVPVGWLVGRWGGYQLVLKSGAVNVLCQALAIWIPRFGPWPFAALLFLTGMANACALVGLFAVIAKWCPPAESSRLMTLVVSGVSMGNALVYSISAGTSLINFIGGWPFNFIIMIGMETVFLLLWACLVTNSPEENKFVKATEASYIITHRPSKTKKQKSPPWSQMLRSPPVYAIVASMYGMDFLVYAIMSIFPEYFVAVRHMSKSSTSLLSGVPWVVCPLVAYLVSQCVDALREKQCLPTITLRKIADFIAKPVSGTCLLLSSLLPDDYEVSSSLLYALSMVFLMGFQGCSWSANMAEMAPEHAGEVFAIAQFVSVTSAFMAPPLCAALTPHNSASEWQLCFGITLAVCVVTSLIYILLASSEPQDWDRDSSEDCEMLGEYNEN